MRDENRDDHNNNNDCQGKTPSNNDFENHNNTTSDGEIVNNENQPLLPTNNNEAENENLSYQASSSSSSSSSSSIFYPATSNEEEEENKNNSNYSIHNNSNLINNHNNNEHDTASMSLDTLADSIRFIIKRDSEIALIKEQQGRNGNHNDTCSLSSPWVLDRSPMLSTSLLRNSSHDQQQHQHNHHHHQGLNEHNFEKKKLLLGKQNQKQYSSFKMSHHNENKDLNSKYSFDDQAKNYKEIHTKIHDEEEQWDRKRKAKLRKVVQKSLSNQSLHSSSSNYSNKNNNNNKNGIQGSMASMLSFNSMISTIGSSSKYSPPTESIINELKLEFSKEKTPPHIAILYGLINFVIVLPVLMSFGSIIYHDEFFKPYLPVLVKLTVVSGVVHQFCFSTFSTLPFAVGQVQDAGLIFLSTIASSIVRYCQDRGRDDEEILATVVVGLSLFTATLGLGLVVIGRLKLASYIQLLPTPVVGGYLAFIGFFCGQGGLSLMSNVEVSGIHDWGKFFHYQQLIWSLPGLIGGIGIYVMMRTLKHIAILPCAVTAGIVLFYVTLEIMGVQLDDAKESGWVSLADSPPVWYVFFFVASCCLELHTILLNEKLFFISFLIFQYKINVQVPYLGLFQIRQSCMGCFAKSIPDCLEYDTCRSII